MMGDAGNAIHAHTLHSKQGMPGLPNQTSGLVPRLTRYRAALMSGVDKVPALNNRVISGGRLNVAKALAKLLGRPEPPAPAKPACE